MAPARSRPKGSERGYLSSLFLFLFPFCFSIFFFLSLACILYGAIYRFLFFLYSVLVFRYSFSCFHRPAGSCRAFFVCSSTKGRGGFSVSLSRFIPSIVVPPVFRIELPLVFAFYVLPSNVMDTYCPRPILSLITVPSCYTYHCPIWDSLLGRFT